MLLRLKITNFLSFYDETVFDMFPNPKRTSFQNHVYSTLQIPLLKQAAIYGANGSGKSNFIKAIWFIKSFVTKEDFLKKIDLEEYRFQLTAEKKATISFELEFFQYERYYIYSLDIEKKSIKESLFLSSIGKDENMLIFNRNGNEISSNFLQNESSAQQLLSLNTQSSLLPLNLKFPVLSTADAKRAYEWFDKQLEIVSINSTVPLLIDIMSQQPKLLNFANQVFENIGVGIKSVKIGDTPFKTWVSDKKNANNLQKIIEQDSLKPNMGIFRMENKRNMFSISVKKGVETVQEFLFDQLGLSGYSKEMKISAQSDGTVRLLTLIPAFYNAVFGHKVVFIDEIDNSIHPNLMFSLLQFYANSQSNGQLIFTTHTTKLLNQQELLRPDEIWLTEKENGNSKMYSINDFKIHNTINLENGYLDGRYGGVPQIEEFGA